MILNAQQNRRAKRALCCLLLMLPLSSYGQNNLPVDLSGAIKQAGFKQGGIGLYIQRVDSAKPLVTFQAQTAFNPASVIKLVTTAASLSILGPGYRWTNGILYSGKINGNTLNGNLYFRGNGDPYLTPERFWRLLNRLSTYGVRNINGNIIVDSTYFAPKTVDYGAFDKQPFRTYHVGPNAVLVGFQATEFHFSASNHGVNIEPFPSSPKLRVINKVRPVKGKCGAWQKRLSLHTKNTKPGLLDVTFTGRYARSCGRRVLYRRVAETSDHFQHFFLPIWQQLGGKFTGKIIQGKVPETASLLFEDKSISLAEAIRYINKFSNNVMTRQLLLSVGADVFGPPGTTTKGLSAIKAWLEQQHLENTKLKLDNGSGLSRDTRISAEQLGKLLHFIFQQGYMPEFMASLPVAGSDGAMAKRFLNDPLQGHAHIKTGLLDFVQTMAGYVTTATGERYVVVLLINNSRAHTRAGKNLQNEVIRWIYDYNSGRKINFDYNQ